MVEFEEPLTVRGTIREIRSEKGATLVDVSTETVLVRTDFHVSKLHIDGIVSLKSRFKYEGGCTYGVIDDEPFESEGEEPNSHI